MRQTVGGQKETDKRARSIFLAERERGRERGGRRMSRASVELLASGRGRGREEGEVERGHFEATVEAGGGRERGKGAAAEHHHNSVIKSNCSLLLAGQPAFVKCPASEFL